MRQTISGLVAAMAIVTASAAPAAACGGLFTGYTPCHTYVSPCAHSCGGHHHYSGYYGGAYAQSGYYAHERLPDPSPQYYYVNQGPTYSGPGNFAPYPTYQESAVSGWGAYRNTNSYYGYDGGRYANATNHYYDDATLDGPAVYSYGPRSMRRAWRARTNYGVSVMGGARLGYGVRPSIRYGYSVQRGMRYGSMQGMRTGGSRMMGARNSIPRAARPGGRAIPSETH
jgi:hypothetical protein